MLNDLQASKSSTGSALDSIQLEREKLMASLRSSVGKSTRQFFPPWNVESQKNWAKSQWEKANEAGTWESFALAYLATLPVSATGPAFDPNKTDLIRSLKTLRSGLLFPPDTQSPIFPRDDRTPEPPTKMEWKSSLDLLIHSLEKY